MWRAHLLYFSRSWIKSFKEFQVPFVSLHDNILISGRTQEESDKNIECFRMAKKAQNLSKFWKGQVLSKQCWISRARDRQQRTAADKRKDNWSSVESTRTAKREKAKGFIGITELLCKVLAVPSINIRANAQAANSAKKREHESGHKNVKKV